MICVEVKNACENHALLPQMPDAEKLKRLQALLGIARLPACTFLTFLLLVTLAPGGYGGSNSSSCTVTPASGNKRRRVSAEQAACVPPTVQRAIALMEAVVSDIATNT